MNTENENQTNTKPNEVTKNELMPAALVFLSILAAIAGIGLAFMVYFWLISAGLL